MVDLYKTKAGETDGRGGVNGNPPDSPWDCWDLKASSSLLDPGCGDFVGLWIAWGGYRRCLPGHAHTWSLLRLLKFLLSLKIRLIA